MSLIDVLTALVVLSILAIPISFSMADNNQSTVDSIKLERAISIVQEKIRDVIVNKTALPMTGGPLESSSYSYKIENVPGEDNIIQATITWKVGNFNRSFVLYSTMADRVYN